MKTIEKRSLNVDFTLPEMVGFIMEELGVYNALDFFASAPFKTLREISAFFSDVDFSEKDLIWYDTLEGLVLQTKTSDYEYIVMIKNDSIIFKVEER